MPTGATLGFEVPGVCHRLALSIRHTLLVITSSGFSGYVPQDTVPDFQRVNAVLQFPGPCDLHGAVVCNIGPSLVDR